MTNILCGVVAGVVGGLIGWMATSGHLIAAVIIGVAIYATLCVGLWVTRP